MKPASRGHAGWMAGAGALLGMACLAGTLALAAAGLWAMRPGAPHYVVNACLTVTTRGAPRVTERLIISLTAPTC
jgi:hypothetical protein